jgi:hypothetical protein
VRRPAAATPSRPARSVPSSHASRTAPSRGGTCGTPSSPSRAAAAAASFTRLCRLQKTRCSQTQPPCGCVALRAESTAPGVVSFALCVLTALTLSRRFSIAHRASCAR